MDLGHTLRAVRAMPHIFLGGVPNERAGEERLAWRKLDVQPGALRLSSEAFQERGAIPKRYAADGANEPPSLRWSGIPLGTESLVLIVEDPDAPTPNPFVHWIVTNISPGADSIADALARDAHQGRNSMFGASWTGCAPPKGDTPHRYVFQLFALDRMLDLGGHPGRTALLAAMRGHVLAYATLTGTYQR